MQLKLNKLKNIYIVPTRTGFLYGALALILLCLGVIFNNSSVLVATSLLVMFGLISMHQTHSNISAVELKKIEPTSGFESQKVPWKLNFKNSSPVTAFSLNIFESIIDIPSDSDFTENIQRVLKKRGRVRVSSLKVSSTYPLGLFYCWRIFENNVQYFIYPKLLENFNLGEIPTNTLTQNGYEDFLGHRDFAIGDSHHHIDWRVEARKEKLMTKIFETYTPDSEVIDWFKLPPVSDEEKLSIAATAIKQFYEQQKSFGLILPNQTFPPEATEAHYHACLEALAVYEVTHV